MMIEYRVSIQGKGDIYAWTVFDPNRINYLYRSPSYSVLMVPPTLEEMRYM